VSSARAVREIQENDLEFIPESISNWYNTIGQRGGDFAINLERAVERR